MTMITDLAARKAYLLGQLNEIDVAESSLYRNRQIRKLGKEYMQVDKQLKEAYAEAEAEKSQSSVPVVSVQEGTDPAAQTVSEDEADNATSDYSSPGKVAASSSETTSKAAQRKNGRHLAICRYLYWIPALGGGILTYQGAGLG